jgi:hypothetical protein
VTDAAGLHSIADELLRMRQIVAIVEGQPASPNSTGIGTIPLDFELSLQHPTLTVVNLSRGGVALTLA